MKIRDERAEPRTIHGHNIPMDAVFSGTIGGTTSVFLQTYEGVIDLAKPHQTWERGVCVAAYQPLDVELVIKGLA